MEYPIDSQDVRGCQFQNTIYREMVMQLKVNAILEANELTGANVPLGLWKYG